MKIAIFSDTFWPRVNGVANVAYKSALTLGELGHDVRVFTVSENGENFDDIAQGKFKVTTSFSLPFWGYPEERFTLPLGVGVRKIKEFRPDIIHSHTPFAVGWEAVLAAKLFKIPLVGTHHTFYDHYLKHVKLDYGWMKKSSWKYIVGYYNRCNLVLSASRSLAEELKKYGLKKTTEVIPNPVDAKLFKPADSKAKKALKKSLGIKADSLVYMGRVSYEKNIGQLIKAVAIVVKEVPDIKFVIVGDGPEITGLKNLAEKLRIEKSIIFTGFCRDQELVRALQANDIFLTASKSENLPISLLEGMAVGLPVIGVRALGVPEIVRDDVNGFLTSTDNPKEIGGRIVELLRDKKKLKDFSAASRRLALKYSQERIAKLLEKTYEKMLK